MNRIGAYFRFQLKHNRNQIFKLIPIKKNGNCKILNDIFENHLSIDIKKIDPDCENSGYFGYMFKFWVDDIQLQGVFESNSLIYPYGVDRPGIVSHLKRTKVSSVNEVFTIGSFLV